MLVSRKNKGSLNFATTKSGISGEHDDVENLRGNSFFPQGQYLADHLMTALSGALRRITQNTVLTPA